MNPNQSASLRLLGVQSGFDQSAIRLVPAHDRALWRAPVINGVLQGLRNTEAVANFLIHDMKLMTPLTHVKLSVRMASLALLASLMPRVDAMSDAQINGPLSGSIISRKEAISKGAIRYFTGNECKNGHIDERYVANKSCVTCCRLKMEISYKENPEKYRVIASRYRDRNPENVKDSQKRYRELNREKMLARRREVYAQNPDIFRERTRTWYHNNPETARLSTRRYSIKNPERVARAQSEWRERNKDRVRAREKEYRDANFDHRRELIYKWRSNNKEACRAHAANRRARIRLCLGSHTQDDITNLLFRQKGKCMNCKKSIKKKYHVDHITPLALGGSNGPDNLQLLCPPCNLSKGACDPIKWAQREGRLL